MSSLSGLLTVPQRAPRLTLAVLAAITLFFGFFARSVRVDSSMENLLPSDDPERLYYQTVRDEFGSEEITVIGVFADDVFAPTTLTKIARITREIAALEGVREVISLTTMETVSVEDGALHVRRLVERLPETRQESAALRSTALANPLYAKQLVSPDGRAAGISVFFAPMSDEEFLERGLDDQIRAIVARAGGPEEYAVTGIPPMKVAAARLMVGDTLKFLPLGTLVVACVLFWAFGTARGVLVPMATVLAGVVWTTGLMSLTRTPINMGTLVLNPLLMAVGISYAIHIMGQYYREQQPGRSPADAVAATVDHIRLPLSLAALTTLAGFATFIFTSIRAIREFGIYSVFGISVIFLLSLALPPAVLVLLPAPRRANRLHDDTSRLARFLRGLGEVAVNHSRAVLLLSGVVCIVVGWGVTHLRVETDYLSFFHASSSLRRDTDRVASGLAGAQPIYIVIDGGAPRAATRPEMLNGLRTLQAYVDQQPGVDKTLSLIDYLRIMQGALNPEGGDLPEAQRDVEQLMLFMNPDNLRPLVNHSRSRANIIVRTSLSGSKEVRAFVDDVQKFAAAHFPSKVAIHPTGSVVLLNRSADRLAWAQVKSLWQVLAVLLLLMSLLFLSIRVGLLSLVPNIVPIVILFGVMGWTDISINISTSLIAAFAIGIAIDDTIHYLSAFNDEMRRTGSQIEAVRNAMRGMGKPMIVTSVALCGGFLVVCLSNFQPVQYFGVLSSLTMAVALFADLFITPAIARSTPIITLWEVLFLKLGPQPHRQIPVFAGLYPFQAKIVVLMARLEAAPVGAMIARRGESKMEMYVLLSGQGEVRREQGQVIRTLGRGDVIGEMGLMRHQKRSADVVVTSAVEYLVLDDAFLQRIRRLYPRIAATVFLNLTRILSDRLESTTDRLAARRDPAPRPASPGASSP